MTAPILGKRSLLLAAPALLMAGCASSPATNDAPAAEAPAEPVATTPDARVVLRNWQVGFIGNVAWGNGTLIHGSERVPFRIRGVGAGGVGMARIRAEGDVFNLRRTADFAGTYGQVRAGAVAPGVDIPGTLWLINTRGVRLSLRPRRNGLALHTGADAVLIELLPTPA